MAIITGTTTWFREADGKQEDSLGKYMTLFEHMVNNAPNVLIMEMIFKH